MKTKTPNVSGRSAWLRDNITKYFSFSAIIILLVALSLDVYKRQQQTRPERKHLASRKEIRLLKITIA